MTRQLNPGLFNDSAPLSPSANSVGTPAADSFSFYDDSSILMADFESFKKEFERMRFDVTENLKTAGLRTDKIIQRMQLFEERLNIVQKETHEKWLEVSTRMRDRGQNEAKIEGLIERHNQIVQSFELRISQAQRLIDNQAVQLAKQQQMIDDARRQIEKLKKL